MTTFIFNTNIIPNEGVVRVTKISTEKAVELVNEAENIVSAIGHQGSVDALAALGINTTVNRIFANPQPGDIAISLKLNGRLEEGRVLNLDAMNEIGYSLFLMEFYSVKQEVLDFDVILNNSNPSKWAASGLLSMNDIKEGHSDIKEGHLYIQPYEKYVILKLNKIERTYPLY